MCTYTQSIQTSVSRADITYDPGQEQVNSLGQGKSKMDATTGILLHSAYQQQNEQHKKPSIKEEEKATELTLKNTKGKAEGTQRYLQYV